MATEICMKYERDDPQQDSDADETLSLCDLPLEGDNSSHQELESNPAHGQDLFQFFTGFNPGPNPASPREIIFCGKAIRSDSPRPSFGFQPKSDAAWTDLQRSQSTTKAMKSSNSLNYAKPNCEAPTMSRTTSVAQKSNTDRKSNSKWFKRCDTSVEGILASAAPRTVRHKWPLFIFGYAKTPKIELKDVRSRQSRMTPPSTMFPWSEAGIVGSDGRKACWSLLRSLGGKGKVKGVMTASLGFLPRN